MSWYYYIHARNNVYVFIHEKIPMEMWKILIPQIEGVANEKRKESIKPLEEPIYCITRAVNMELSMVEPGVPSICEMGAVDVRFYMESDFVTMISEMGFKNMDTAEIRNKAIDHIFLQSDRITNKSTKLTYEDGMFSCPYCGHYGKYVLKARTRLAINNNPDGVLNTVKIKGVSKTQMDELDVIYDCAKCPEKFLVKATI